MIFKLIVLLALLYFKGGVTSNANTEEITLPKIVGGSLAPLGTVQHQVSVQRINSNIFYHMCGGSIVSMKNVVTAATCFLNQDNILIIDPSLYQVKAGEVDLYSESWQIRKAIYIFVHHDFDRRTKHADIAVIALDSSFFITTVLSPARITNQPFTQGTLCRVSGWGTTHENSGFLERFLRYATVPIVDQQICGEVYNYTTSHNILYDMVCAGYHIGGVGVCQGDNGGPLTCNNVLAGIVSWSYGCARAGYYNVYTRIEIYNTWINRMITNSYLE